MEYELFGDAIFADVIGLEWWRVYRELSYYGLDANSSIHKTGLNVI